MEPDTLVSSDCLYVGPQRATQPSIEGDFPPAVTWPKLEASYTSPFTLDANRQTKCEIEKSKFYIVNRDTLIRVLCYIISAVYSTFQK